MPAALLLPDRCCSLSSAQYYVFSGNEVRLSQTHVLHQFLAEAWIDLFRRLMDWGRFRFLLSVLARRCALCRNIRLFLSLQGAGRVSILASQNSRYPEANRSSSGNN